MKEGRGKTRIGNTKLKPWGGGLRQGSLCGGWVKHTGGGGGAMRLRPMEGVARSAKYQKIIDQWRLSGGEGKPEMRTEQVRTCELQMLPLGG